mmetsp:Transcript_110863/g.353261  ORF Transcript_110863/g.353261 Transcript_110863/m.353261 type:complete len:148 (-) Transcript_110863:153-596(-)
MAAGTRARVSWFVAIALSLPLLGRAVAVPPAPVASSALRGSLVSVETTCGVPDSYPSTHGPTEALCPFCRWCCKCNANDSMDCEHSLVSPDKYGGPKGVVVFCDKCHKCTKCPAFNDMAACPRGNCCDNDMKHQPPFNATWGSGEYR